MRSIECRGVAQMFCNGDACMRVFNTYDSKDKKIGVWAEMHVGR